MSMVQLVPICRLTDRMVRSGFVIACRFATSPTSTSPDFAKPTTDGVVRLPSALGMTVGSPPSSTLTTEFVVPRSIPTALGMKIASKSWFFSELGQSHHAGELTLRVVLPISIAYLSASLSSPTDSALTRISGADFPAPAGGARRLAGCSAVPCGVPPAALAHDELTPAIVRDPRERRELAALTGPE